MSAKWTNEKCGIKLNMMQQQKCCQYEIAMISYWFCATDQVIYVQSTRDKTEPEEVKQEILIVH